MTRKDLDRIFTAKVTGLLAQGYQIHTGTMRGSQGELAHIDLSKGSEIIRVLLEQKYDCRSECGDCISIRVGRNTEPLRGGWDDTIWNERLETLSEIKLAKVTDNYFTTMEEGETISKKRLARWQNSARAGTSRRALSDAYKSTALHWVQKQPRMKTCRLEEIESVTRVNKTAWGKVLPDLDGYEIKARGKVFVLSAHRKA